MISYKRRLSRKDNNIEMGKRIKLISVTNVC